jgi:hypothetical protein
MDFMSTQVSYVMSPVVDNQRLAMSTRKRLEARLFKTFKTAKGGFDF